jgi:hypothetical protein
MTDGSGGKPTSARPVRTSYRFKHTLHALSLAVLVGVQLAACAAGFLYATGHLLGLPEIVLDGILGLVFIASVVLSWVLFVRTRRVEAAIERGEDGAFVTWNPLHA